MSSSNGLISGSGPKRLQVRPGVVVVGSVTFTEGQPYYSMTWIHERFKVLKCKVQAGENDGTWGCFLWGSSESYQISGDVGQTLDF